ncbi:hypothetical protein RF11_15776 [Thelohanellus kitauei]|uniref:Uncharacterized protein n=1 Tax=Thelohanellus kitauei TaxID=669202 RepID=A0A0C2NCQ2_THEKT|nr:hypothetical protein RF11_15776 [Thelohanellus kitauei]
MDVHTTVTVKKYASNLISKTMNSVMRMRPTFIPSDKSMIFLHDDKTLCYMHEIYHISGQKFYIIQGNSLNYPKINVSCKEFIILVPSFEKLHHGLQSYIVNNTEPKLNFIGMFVPINKLGTTDVSIFFSLSMICAKWIKEIRTYSENIGVTFQESFEEKCLAAYDKSRAHKANKITKEEMIFITKFILCTWGGFSIISIIALIIMCAKKRKQFSTKIEENFKKFTKTVLFISD